METLFSCLCVFLMKIFKETGRQKHQRELHSLSTCIQELLTFCHFCFINIHIYKHTYIYTNAVLFEICKHHDPQPLKYFDMYLLNMKLFYCMTIILLLHLRHFKIMSYYLVSSLQLYFPDCLKNVFYRVKRAARIQLRLTHCIWQICLFTLVQFRTGPKNSNYFLWECLRQKKNLMIIPSRRKPNKLTYHHVLQFLFHSSEEKGQFLVPLVQKKENFLWILEHQFFLADERI